MANTRVMIFEGSHGQTSFFKDTLLTEGLADQVDSVNRVDQAIGRIHHPDAYDLVVINLAQGWEQGIQLGSWFNRQSTSCPVMLLSPSQSSQTLPSNAPFVSVPTPLSPYDFAESVRAIL